MGRLADLIAAGTTPLWIESTAYAQRLLAGGNVAWGDAAEVVAWHRKAQGLVRSDVVSLSLTPIVSAWFESDGELAEEMRAKKRATAPLKVLLASDGLRNHIAEIVKGLRTSYANAPLALVIQSPRRWVAHAYALAHHETLAVGEDEADSAAMYIADFLRSFGELGVDVLLLEESAESLPASAGEIAWYQPVFNIAAHYRWECGIHLPAASDIGGAEGLNFCIAPQAIDGLTNGIGTGGDASLGSGPVPVPAGGFRYIEIPENAQPEATLERLAALR